MAINKVEYGDQTLMDLTEDTVTEDKVLEGETFHDRSGNSRVGSLVIPVQDVEVNGESVVDPTTKIAEIISYEEVTQVEYDNLPSSKESDKVLYMVYSDGQILDPNYSYHKYGNNDEIIVRVYHEGELDQQTLWFFRGWNQTSGDMAIPSSLRAYAPSSTSIGVQSANYPDAPYTTQNGWIGFYNGNIRGWSTDFYNFYTGICHCVVDPEGTGYPNPQTNPYIDDPYIYVHDPSVRSARRIYLNGREYAEFNIPTTDIQTAVDEFETYNGGLLSSCKVSLTPNQDLHGYDSPWVGGAGKNKYNNQVGALTTNGVTFTPNTDGTVTVNGTATANAYYNMTNTALPANTYIANGSPSGGSDSSYELDVYNNTTSSVIGADRGSGVSFSTNGTDEYRLYIRIANGYTVNNLVIKPMLRLATETDPTFEPYENICPISGHTQVDVDVSDGQTTQEQVTVNLGGTYYSGTLDVVSGVLTIDKALLTFSGAGSEGWIVVDSGRRVRTYILLGSVKPTAVTEIADIISSAFVAVTANDTYLGNIGIAVDAGSALYVASGSTMDLTSWTAYLASNPLQVCYTLVTPTPIQLSPTMVKALVGENHLSAPLEGQEITESKFRELFTYDDIEPEAYKIARDTAVSIVEANAAYNSVKYSTGSHKVGKWVDGTDLIETTYIVNSGITFGGTYNYISLPSYYKVRDYKGFIARTTGALDGFIYGYQGMSGDDISTLGIRPSNIEFSVQSALQTNFEYVSITIQYTVDL